MPHRNNHIGTSVLMLAEWCGKPHPAHEINICVYSHSFADKKDVVKELTSGLAIAAIFSLASG